MSGRGKSSHLRRRLAYEAARLMLDQGLRDHALARRKAAERMGLNDSRLWPKNAEIQEALLEQQRLFRREQPEEIRNLRLQALEAMRVFERFHPRLVGSVLEGNADRDSRVRLHLFAEAPEEVVHALLQRGIPWEERECTLRYGGGARKLHPLLRFVAGEVRFELVVLPLQAQANPPLSPLTERPERGAGIGRLQALLDGRPSVQETMG